MRRYDGDWMKVVKHIRVRRLVFSEQDRVGIGTFQPKDEKNQDSTELTGDINYRKIAIYGSDSDPRAFNFDGEFNIANRGVIEFVEMLKLDVAFLYDLLGATQEHKIKPKKFAQTDIDEVILGHTNEPEYRRLQNNEFMEALRDRTVCLSIPCYAERRYGGVADDELLMACPPDEFIMGVTGLAIWFKIDVTQFLPRWAVDVAITRVMDLIIKGQRTQQIADQLAVSPRTVEAHSTNAKRKLKARTIAHMSRRSSTSTPAGPSC